MSEFENDFWLSRSKHTHTHAHTHTCTHTTVPALSMTWLSTSSVSLSTSSLPPQSSLNTSPTSWRCSICPSLSRIPSNLSSTRTYLSFLRFLPGLQWLLLMSFFSFSRPLSPSHQLQRFSTLSWISPVSLPPSRPITSPWLFPPSPT